MVQTADLYDFSCIVGTPPLRYIMYTSVFTSTLATRRKHAFSGESSRARSQSPAPARPGRSGRTHTARPWHWSPGPTSSSNPLCCSSYPGCLWLPVRGGGAVTVLNLNSQRVTWNGDLFEPSQVVAQNDSDTQTTYIPEITLTGLYSGVINIYFSLVDTRYSTGIV